MTELKNYQYLLFDWDGCLADTLEIWLEQYEIFLLKWGVKLSRAEICEAVFGDWNAPARYGVKDLEAFWTDMLVAVDQEIAHAQLHEGALAMLSQFKEHGKKLAIVTSSKITTITPALTNLGITDLFDLILTKESITKTKPDPEIIFKALTEFEANKEETIIIGDSGNDIVAGKAAGITTVCFYPEKHRVIYPEKIIRELEADYLIKSLSELKTIIS